MEYKLNNELSSISEWLRDNELSLNIGKTNYVTFHSPQRKMFRNKNLKIYDSQISQENQLKCLGLIIDRHSHLSWKPQVQELAEKISRGIGLLQN